MKPRTKLEHDILALAVKLPEITERQRRWAFDNCFKGRAVVWPRKRQVRCMCCGETAVYDKVYIDSFLREGQYDCPYCGKTMDAERHEKDTKWTEYRHFTVLTTFRGHQVARTWEVRRNNEPRTKYASYGINEIYQVWLTDDGREVITGRPLHRSINSTTWDFVKPLDIRRHNAGGAGYYQFDDVYDIAGNWLYPEVRVTPLLRRNGWRPELLKYQNMIAMTDAMKSLLTIPDDEMLVKTGQLDLFRYMVRRGHKEVPFRYAVRIANRNGYIVNDAQMWLDMLQMADELGRDTHNPKVVCPDDLRAAHDALLGPITRLHKRRDAEKRRREAGEWETRYTREKAPYLGIAFGDDDITVRPLQMVDEFAEEGKAMHHCVFGGGYYKKPDSLILTARDRDGKRLETVEVSLCAMTVLQSRAACNGTSPLHAQILALVCDNMYLIRRAKAEADKAVNPEISQKCQRV